jgi:hypothetical protein
LTQGSGRPQISGLDDPAAPSDVDTAPLADPPRAACPRCGVALTFEVPRTIRIGDSVRIDVTHTEDLGVRHVVEVRDLTAGGDAGLVARAPGRTPLSARIQARRRAGRVVDA